MTNTNVAFTLFPDLGGKEGTEYATPFLGMAEWLLQLPEFPSKDACPLISLSRYGTNRTAKDSRRHNANILDATGALGDYDAGIIPPAEAAQILQTAGIEAIIVTTPSHGLKGNRWRVIAPFTNAHTIEQRHDLMGRLNTVLGGVLAGESFTASQAFYVGRVVGVPYEVHTTTGTALDTLPGIENITPTAPAMAQPRTGSVDSFALVPKRASGGVDQVRTLLSGIPNIEPDWERWNKIGMAIYNATAGSDEGLETWRDWSDRCPVAGASDDSVDQRWAHYRGSPPTAVGTGTLHYMAQPENGGELVQRVDQPVSVVESEAVPGVAACEEVQLVSGFQYLAATQQIEHFAGCVYVQDVHRIFTPRGVLLKPEQFKATYGGYIFTLDAENSKVTKSAYEAFTESQAVRYPIAEGMTFRPELPPGKMTKEEGRALVNTYTPAEIDKRRGDVSPFLDHLSRILPDPMDAAILLAYMAACIQHIGVKFQWAPLLQGCEGNGKTLFTRCVSYAVGMQYSHFPKADEVGNKFNSWMLRKTFIGIEDVWFPDHRREIIESLKPLITNDMLPIELKGVDQISAHVCANFMLNSNHKDAIRKTNNDRRFAVFFTAQQAEADIRRDGMEGEYFPDLYDWLKGEGIYLGQPKGYAYVAEFLSTYPIPEELNPATKCHRAPRTSTTDQAIAHGVGSVEQEIMEAIDEGRPGFAGGWVSSMALDRLLEALRLTRAIPPNRRREMMQGLGYDWHPSLKDGRVNNAIAIDHGRKPRLFIKDGHADLALQTPANVSQAYQGAQGTSAMEAFGSPPN